LLVCLCAIYGTGDSATKPGVIYTSKPSEVDAMFGDVYRKIPVVVTIPRVYVAGGATVDITIPYNFGDKNNFGVVFSMFKDIGTDTGTDTATVWSGLFLWECKAQTGNTVRFYKDATDVGFVSLICTSKGIWGT
jgi:hypothetical protein